MSNYQINQSVVQDLLADKNTIIDKFNSNRIVSIPQGVIVTFDDGVLTIKAGTKLYIPNGFESDGTTPKFETVVMTTDCQIPNDRTGKTMFGMHANKTQWRCDWSNGTCIATSGTTFPDNPINFHRHYKLDENLIYTWTSSTGWTTSQESLPLGVCTYNSDKKVKSVDQLFNGFGYIGSTCYILPGITGYIPKGLNSDGTLINEIITQTKLSITTVTSSWGTGSETFFFNGVDSYIHRASKNCFYQATQPIVKDVEDYWFNTASGKYYETRDSGLTWTEFKAIPAFTITFDNSLITSLKSCGVHELVNSNATNLSDYGREIISGLGKPSDKYIDLTVGASGTTYIAPMNGYIYCSGHANASPAYISIDIPNLQYCGINGNEGHDLTTNQIALKIGDKFTLRYSNTTINAFRFVYDEGCS